MQDLHSNIKVVPALTLRAAIATDTTTAGSEIDLQGYESCEFIIASGVLTDGSYTPLIEESDVSGSGFAAVADADLISTEAAEAFAATDNGEVHKIGYVGHKRYVKLSIVSASTTSGGFLAAVAVLGHARHNPVA
jgi:hypothetical protein